MSYNKKASGTVQPFEWKSLPDVYAGPNGGDGGFTQNPLEELQDAAPVESHTRAGHGSGVAGMRRVRWEELEEQGPGWGARESDSAAGSVGPVESAKMEAERLLSEAKAQGDAIREEASRQGREEGRVEALRILEEQAASLEAVVREVAGFKARLYHEARQEVVDLALALVGKLVGPLVENDQQVVVRVVERALQGLSEREALTLRVHPEDLKSVVEAKPTILETFDGIQRLTVMEDLSVRRGGCLIQTSTTEIDARLETQLEELRQSLRRN